MKKEVKFQQFVERSGEYVLCPPGGSIPAGTAPGQVILLLVGGMLSPTCHAE